MPQLKLPESSATQVVDYQEYVDAQINRTSRAVKALDVCQAVLWLVVVGLVVLLAGALAEHWLTRGGFSNTTRYLFFGGLLAAVGWWLARQLWPLATRPINPVYAAATIEETSPTLKNSLVNLLLFRGRNQPMPAAVLKGMQRQAAERLVGTRGDEVVDWRNVIRLGYVLVGLLILGTLYTLFSPKNPLVTAARVLAPWANISAPTRVQISDVTPGAGEAIRGEQIEVAAVVEGLEEDEQPMLVVLSGNSSEEHIRLPLKRGEGLDRHQTDWLPTPSQSAPAVGDTQVRYRIEAGDARSQDFDLTLLTAPAIVVRRIDYDYPEYTGYLDRTAEGVGDVRAIEGTRVTIHAEANTPIAAAQIDFQGDGRPDRKLQVDAQQATVSWTLALRDDRRTPIHSSYVLRFTSTQDRTNADPASYPIEVLADYPPEVQILAPQKPTREVRLNETVVVQVEARDPDFGLSSVRVRGESLGDKVFDAPVLAQPATGRFEGRWRFTPTEHGLRVGDIVDYWAVAEDIRQPEPHQTATRRQRFRIVAADPNQGADNSDNQLAERPADGQQPNERPADQEPAGDAQQGGDQNGEQNGEQGTADGQGGQPEQGEKRGGEKNGGENNGGEKNGNDQQPQQGAEQGGKQGGEQAGDPAGGENRQQQPDKGEDQGGEAQGGENNQGGMPSNDQAQPAGDNANQQQEGQPGEATNGATDGATDRGNANNQAAGGKNNSNQPDGAQAGGRDAQQQPGQRNPAANRGDGDGLAGAGDNNPVSAEGDDDAAAFDRIRNHLEQQQPPKPGDQSETGEPNGGQNADGQQGKRQPQGDSQQANPQPADGQSEAGKPEGGQQGDSQAGDNNQRQPGEGAKPNDQRGDNPGGEGDAAQPGNQPPQSPAEQQPDRQPSDGSQGDSDAPADRKQQSESTNNQSGEKIGNNDSAQNSEAPRQGTGAQGKNEAADQGSGTASDQGPGNESTDGGDKQPAADGQQGNPGDKPGPGSQQRDGQGNQPGGEKPGGEKPCGEKTDGNQPGGQNPGDPEANAPNPGSGEQGQPGEGNQPGQPGEQPGMQPGEGQPGNQPGNQPGQPGAQAGQPGDANPQPGGSSPANAEQHGFGGGEGEHRGGEPGGDEANLEFTRKKTDLLLDKLSNQLRDKKVDQDLLDRLGWTEEDLRRFVARWNSRKQAAQQRDGGGKQELDDALRSLGWRDKPLGKAGPTKQDELRDLRSGYRGNVPAKFRDRLRRYNQGVSQSDQQ